MALLKPKPPVPTPLDPIQVTAFDEGYRGVTVDSELTPLAGIIQYMEGSIWEVEYFSQVLGADNAPQPHDLGLAAAYQQYALVKGMELRVNSPLQPSQDPEGRSMILEGTAVTPPGIIPNKGDMFFADIGDGREAALTVTTTEKKTHLKQSVYLITYEVVRYSDDDRGVLRRDLDSKLIRVQHYVKDFLVLGANPLVLSSDFNYRIEFKKSFESLLNFYLTDFYSYEYRTLLVPDQVYPTYDPLIVHEFVRWIDMVDHPMAARIERPRVTMANGRLPASVFSAISERDMGVLYSAIQKTGLVNRLMFRGQPDLGGFFYSGIPQCVYPLGNSTNVDDPYTTWCDPYFSAALAGGHARYTDLARVGAPSTLPGLLYPEVLPDDEEAVPVLPMFAPVSLSGYYVFSQNLYAGEGVLASDLERLIVQSLKEDTVDKATLAKLTQNVMKLNNLERFYYIPALIALLQIAIRNN